jgi:glutamine amidotransferase
MITIVDYGMGNVGSILNILKRSGFGVSISSKPEDIRTAEKLILPGVGAFDTGMANLDRYGLRKPIEDKVGAGTPVLGICLGMQLLFEGSEEGDLPGLGWMRGHCKRFRFPDDSRLKVPHMGWNAVRPVERESLFREMDDDARYYFVHSYHAVCEESSVVIGWTVHGYEFAAAVRRDNIFGTQFHPEKSHKHGRRLLKNFAES